MRLKAYILAADPAWIEASVLSYYDIVEEILVSYDQDSKGWTGAPVDVEECLRRLRAIDRDGKMRYSPGHYARLEHQPMENETYQRQCAIDEIGDSADWILQLDTDEVLPRSQALLDVLAEAQRMDVPAVEWPMRVLFRRLADGRFLEVCSADGKDRYEYPGPIAVRSGVRLVDARRADGTFLRPVASGDAQSLQVIRPPEARERRVTLPEASDAIIHNTWARLPASIKAKIRSWGHNVGLKSWLFYYTRWLPAPYTWRWMRDFHPFARGLWPALRPWDAAASGVDPRVLERVG